MPEGDPNFGITRLDHEESGTRGWQVRIQRRRVRRTGYFSDRRHGGRNASLRKAREFRDRLLEKMKPFSRAARAKLKSERNSSGAVGVCKVSNAGKYGIHYEFWQATWSPRPGERKSARFSISKYGDRKAFQKACRARREGEREMEG